jgi:valyl-tRNA synthetase
MIKPRLRQEDEAGDARQVLAYAIDQVLRLFHPFIPFLTEFLWQRLNQQVPQRGIEQPLRIPELLVRAPWPRANAAWLDTQAEQHIDFLQQVIRAIRDIRSRYNVPPKDRVRVRIKASGEASERLNASMAHLCNLAGVESLEIAADAKRTADAATAVVGDMEIYVLGIIDVERERGRLTAQIAKLSDTLAGVHKKLANENFIARANPEVVDRERARLVELESQIGTLNAHLQMLE